MSGIRDGDSAWHEELSPALGFSVTETVRSGLRLVMQLGPRCPLCGRAGEEMSLREVAPLTGVSHNTLARFLRGQPIKSDTLDRLYQWVNARLSEATPAPKGGRR